MLWLRLTLLTNCVIVVATSSVLVFLTRAWLAVVGVAAAVVLTVFAGHRTADKLFSCFDVVRTITDNIFPFIRRTVKSSRHYVDISEGYELETELSKLLNNIVEHCIECWYRHISDCCTPVNDARLLIRYVIRCLVGRFSCIDRYQFLCKILLVYRRHLGCCFSNTSCIHCRNILSSDSAASLHSKHLADSEHSDTVRYVNAVVFKIISKLIDEQYGSCLLGKEILAQIITKEVILRAVEIASQPEWLYDIVADILSDSTDGHFVTTNSCTDLSSDTNADLQESNSSCCLPDMTDYCVSCDSEATATDCEVLAASGSVTNMVRANSDAVSDTEEFINLLDTESGSCSDECVLVNGRFSDSAAILGYRSGQGESSYSQDSSHRTRKRPKSDSDFMADSAAILGYRSGQCESSYSQDSSHRTRKRPKSDSDFMANGLEKSANGDVCCKQLHGDANSVCDTLPESIGNHMVGAHLKHFVSPMNKKRFSLGDLLSTLRTQDQKQKAVDLQCASNVVCQMSADDRNQPKEDQVAKISFYTASSQHTLLKTKSSSSSLNAVGYDDESDDDDYVDINLDVKPSISHSASVNVLLPESGFDKSANFVSRHLSHLVRRVSSRSAHLLCHTYSVQQCPAADSVSDPELELELINDREAAVISAEASEDLVVSHRPQFLFDSICIAETERDIPVSKPYTVYVISVRSIQSFYPLCPRLFAFCLSVCFSEISQHVLVEL